MPSSLPPTAVTWMRAGLLCALPVALSVLSCATDGGRAEAMPLHYVGSSSIAHFMRAAQEAYGEAGFVIETEPESVGGEEAILTGQCDLAGYAGSPRAPVVRSGLEATMLGRDAIAVIVHPTRDIDNLSLDQLAGIFSGRIRDWAEVGGAAGEIRALIVGPASATRKVFRAAVLGSDDYGACETVGPDADILTRVASDSNAIGQISSSFPIDELALKVLAVDGVRATDGAGQYAITRPLYLLWWPGRERVARFVQWLTTGAGRELRSSYFSGRGLRSVAE
jgi:phosphate transport system substrate-binding protein